MKMNWENLLSLKRHGDKHKRIRKEQDESRLGFEVDYDRVIFSSHFRKLQDKTQVVPLSREGFVHTRLTHSLEVSVVARSLGRLVGQELLQKYPHVQQSLGYKSSDFGAIVAAAALAHDIGNPPFGHSGEKAMGDFFSSGEGAFLKSEMNEAEHQNLCQFEGNANGFKILTQNKKGKPGGLRLSYATLGAFIKYPKPVLPHKPLSHIAMKKFGVFQSEMDFFQELCADLGMTTLDKNNHCFTRHPFAYLVEAADDICYTIIDFEDGINLGLIEEEKALELLVQLVKDKINTQVYAQLQQKEDRVSYLRSIAINILVQEAAQLFMENETAILNGTFSTSLLEVSKYKSYLEDILKVSISKIYQSKEVVEKEITGYQVLQNLLGCFIMGAYRTKMNQPKLIDKLIFKRFENQLQLDFTQSIYQLSLEVCHFIAGQSDSGAIEMNKILQNF